MIQDLHSHTYYSLCSADEPEKMIQNAIDSGIELLGICDHNYGISYITFENYFNLGTRCNYGDSLYKYYHHIKLLKEKYANKIKILCGLEIATTNNGTYPSILPDYVDVSFFDYCLVEHIDIPSTITNGDIISFAKRCKCPVGIAHTDLFTFIKNNNLNPLQYFQELAKNDIFWELNVNYDSTHAYREHPYVIEFFKNKEQQEIIKQSGVKLSIGFDGHKYIEYDANRVKSANEFVKSLGIKLAFDNE